MATNSNQSRGEGSHAPSKRRGTGPRTAAGKDRSKQNAIKHGLLSQVVVLNHESQSEFDDLLNGLRRNLKPEGTLEEELVGKIAVLLWRHRRFIQVEHAGIQQNIDAQQNHEAGYSRAALRIESMVEKHIAETDRRGGLFE